MSEHIKYATSHLHELAAKIEEMVFNGYRVDHRSAFAARRVGSAYQIYFIPTREALDFDDDNYSEQEEQILAEAYTKIAEGRVSKTSAAERAILDAAFANIDQEENCNHIDKQAVEELNQLTIQQKWEIDDELAEQAQELDMGYDKRKIYTKEELEAMEWPEFKGLIDQAGIRGRRRQNLTRDYLIWQEVK